MSEPRRLRDGRILAMVPGEGPNGERAEGLVPIGPDHPAFPVWDDYLPPIDNQE